MTGSIEEYFSGVFDRQQRREKSNILRQTWVGGMLTIAPVTLIWARLVTAPCSARCILLPMFVLSCVTPCLGFCSIISPKFFAALVSRAKKSKVRTQRQVLQAASQACSQARRARPGSSEAATCETLHTKELAPSVCTLHRQAFVAADRHMTASILTPESQRLFPPLTRQHTAVETTVS